MLFNSFIFFIFLGIILPVFYALPGKRSKNIFLLAASYFFYGYWDWRFCFLIAISTIIDYFIGQLLHKTTAPQKRKRLLLISLFSNLGILGFFKYFNFFIDSFQVLSASFGLSVDFLHLNILLPVGISFYTFQTLSYTIDIYRGKVRPANNFIDFALFVAFFPQLVAGPIERASALLPQLRKKLKPSRLQIEQGIVLVVMGLFRKVMIGDTAGRFSDHIFGNLESYKSIEIICALLLFTLQVYADFSGYSHIARGTAKLLGVELIKNFEQPYFSRNISEYWSRWHISLSSWLRDYLYFSLGGNRVGKFRSYLNLMITMLLGGLWHGASWNYVFWGGLHGFYLVVHKIVHGKRKPSRENIRRFRFKDIINIIMTFVLVMFSLAFFRTTSWDQTELFFSKIVNWESSEYTFLFMTIGLSYLFITILQDLFEYRSGRHTYLLMIRSRGIQIGILAALFFVTLLYMFQSEPLPFIYFQF